MTSLPTPWQQHVDTNDKTLYYNPETYEATYAFPQVGNPVQAMILHPIYRPELGKEAVPKIFHPLKNKGPNKQQHARQQSKQSFGDDDVSVYYKGNDVLLHLGENSYATVSAFKGYVNVHIRQFYEQNFVMLPSKTGVALGRE